MDTNTQQSDSIIAKQALDEAPVMVKVDDVSMVFNMASEQFTNLKEYAIALAKRELMFKEFRALNHVSFEVRKGDVFGIMGTNGSGKSTMLKIIAGVLEPTSGTCEIHGNIAPLIELGAGFDMELTARENVYLNGALLGYSKSFIDEHFDEIIDFAEVQDFLDIPMKNYSSGMISRIAFAIATVIIPEILVCDEVLAVGDFMFQKKCENRIRQLIDEYGVTVLIVSHSNEQIARLCNKAIWIEKGHTKLMGSAAEVCRIYGSIGGRTGSKEAEEHIFNMLQEMPDRPAQPKTIFASNPFELIATTAMGLSSYRHNKSAIVISSATHLNALFAAQLAVSLDAFIVSCAQGSLPSPTLHALSMHKPKTIYFIDCGASSTRVLSDLEILPWKPDVIDLSGSGNPTEYSLELLDYGIQQESYGDTAIMLDFESNMESFALIPLIRQKRAPLVVTWTANAEFHRDSLEDFIPKFESAGIQNIIVAGNAIPDVLLEPFTNKFSTFFVANNDDSEIERARQVANMEMSMLFDKGRTLFAYISTISTGQRTYLPAICNDPHDASLLLFCDTNNMDSILSSMSFLEQHSQKISDIAFLGSDNAFFEKDCQLLARAIDD